MSFFEKLKRGLTKTKDALLKPVNDLFSSYDKVDEDFYDELSDIEAEYCTHDEQCQQDPFDYFIVFHYLESIICFPDI